MLLHLHNPTSQAHIVELQARLADHLRDVPVNPQDPSRPQALVGTLSDIVRAMDKGAVSPETTRVLFGCFRITGFSFDRWLAEMLDEGVYMEQVVEHAA